MPKRITQHSNPFRFGALALDEAFADREAEVRALKADVRNGQDVVVFAPRRYGKSSLVWRTAQELTAAKVLVAQVDLMTAPTKEKLAEKLAKAIFEGIASPLHRAAEQALAPFRGLRVEPTVTVSPEDGSFSFSFSVGRREDDIDATLERLLQLPPEMAASRRRKVALILDEFQEVVEIDRRLPRLLRSVFQEQPDVAHVYLGSKRHMMESIFNDENEPFWRSAKQVELGVIDPEAFAPFVLERFRASGRPVGAETAAAVLERTGGHPYATQELCYSLWERVAPGSSDGAGQLEAAVADVLRSEHAHFSLLWERATSRQRLLLEALANEPGRPFANEYRARHRLPAPSSLQRALAGLVEGEVVAKGADGRHRIAEPFLADWVRASVGGD
jgi:hypothetical protein